MTKYNVPAEIFKFLQDNDIQTDGYASVRNYRGKVSLRHDTYLEVLKIVRIDSRLGGKQDCLNRMLLGYSIIVVTGA